MALNDSDPTCVRSILESFKRKAGPNRMQSPDVTPSAATRLNFEEDSCSPVSPRKRKKSNDSNELYSVHSNKEELHSSMIGSPWEARRLKTELIDAKVQITNLQMRVNQLHALRRELEVVFEAEKNGFLQQQDRDLAKIQNLESRIAQLRRRESDVRDEFSFEIKGLEETKYRLEKSVLGLRKQNSQLTDELSEVKKALKEAEHIASLHDVELKKLKYDLILSQKKFQDESKEHVDITQTSHTEHYEKLVVDLKEALRKIKDLESELEANQEASEIVKAHQHKLLHIPDLEQEIQFLKNENSKLREAARNKVLLEEEVADLWQKCASSSEWERQLVEMKAQHQIFEDELSQWRSLVRDFCIGVAEKDVCPSVLRHQIQDLQQSEVLLRVEVNDLEMRFKALHEEKSRLDSQISRSSEEIIRLKASQEQQAILIKRWQKKLALITGERNSYREQLDSYEKELTVSGINHQQQISHARLEALEKSLEGYRELVETLESELSSAVGQGGSKGLTEKLRAVTAERERLRGELLKSQAKCDELQIQLENKVLSGDLIPKASKILHFKMNPVARAEEEQNKEILVLRSEVATLKERVKVLQEGEQDDITCKVNQRLASTSSQEVQELREKVKSADLMIQRLKEAFKKTSSEFRDCVYQLLGYKVDRLQNKGMFRLSSMYAESPNDYLLFKMETSGTLTLLETPFSASIEELIDVHLGQQGSLPIFLAAITMDLFSRQSMLTSVTSVVNAEPITLD